MSVRLSLVWRRSGAAAVLLWLAVALVGPGVGVAAAAGGKKASSSGTATALSGTTSSPLSNFPAPPVGSSTTAARRPTPSQPALRPTRPVTAPSVAVKRSPSPRPPWSSWPASRCSSGAMPGAGRRSRPGPAVAPTAGPTDGDAPAQSRPPSPASSARLRSGGGGAGAPGGASRAARRAPSLRTPGGRRTATHPGFTPRTGRNPFSRRRGVLAWPGATGAPRCGGLSPCSRPSPRS